ncbi:MAG: hypothetical protein ACRDF0_05020, partial [Candidatus Limnocylindria bacterium]
AGVLAALAGLLAWRWRDLGRAAALLGPLALFFAWRSLQNYFTFAGALALAGDAAVRSARTEVRDGGGPRPAGDPGLPGGQGGRA